MWPYNLCEWKTITYGLKKLKEDKQKRDEMKVAIISLIPSTLLIGFIIFFAIFA